MSENQELANFLQTYFNKYYRDKCYPGLIFEQGKRTMLQINVPAHELPTLLQAKPSTNNDPDSGKNRPEVKGHAEEIKEYILDRVENNQPWLVGTLTANVDPEKIEIINLGRGFCLVIIPRSVKLDITDGQHRKRAIHELIEGPQAELIGNNDFPITIVLEKDFRQCQTDFRDMALTKALDKSLLLSFGEFEGRVGISKILIDQFPMFQDKTEKIKASASAKKKLIYTTNNLVRFISLTFTNNADDDLKSFSVENSAKLLIDCLSLFFTQCAETSYIFNTNINDLTVEDVYYFRDNCILGTSVGLEVLGRLLYLTYNRNSHVFDLTKVEQLTKIKWTRDNNLWHGNIVMLDINATNSTKKYKMGTSPTAVKLAINLVQRELEWL